MGLFCEANQSAAQHAYDVLAPHYDELTAHHRYDEWMKRLLPALEKEGLTGKRLLDLGCGTGKTTLPLAARGWNATAVDISPGMLRQLAAKTNGQVEIVEADIADLPALGEFDLILSLGEAMNYAAAEGGFARALDGIRRNLAPEGLALFDLKTLASYESFYGQREVKPAGEYSTTWSGQVKGSAGAGELMAATMEIEGPDGKSTVSHHRQRHVSEAEAIGTIAEAGMERVAVYGHDYSAVLEQPLDQRRHTRGIFIAQICRQPEERG